MTPSRAEEEQEEKEQEEGETEVRREENGGVLWGSWGEMGG